VHYKHLVGFAVGVCRRRIPPIVDGEGRVSEENLRDPYKLATLII
jgi:hypothetical protein